jgi:hypothetical protein
MAKSKQWTVIAAEAYYRKHFNDEHHGLTFWAAYDFLNNHGGRPVPMPKAAHS